MAQNVEMITKNIASAEELQTQSQNLLSNAQSFKTSSTSMKRRFHWKNIKVCFYYFIVLIYVCYGKELILISI